MTLRLRANVTILLLFVTAFLLMVLSSCNDDGCPTGPPCDDPAPVGWFQQASPTQERLLRIDVIDASTVVAVGNAGTIVRTSDGGSTWTVVPSGTTDNLLSVFFVDSAAGWIVGSNSTLLKSTDAGLTWTPVSLPVPTDLRAIQFVSADRGYTAGGPGQGQTGGECSLRQPIAATPGNRRPWRLPSTGSPSSMLTAVALSAVQRCGRPPTVPRAGRATRPFRRR